MRSSTPRTYTPAALLPYVADRSSSSSSSSRSSFVKIPPAEKFIVNERMVKLPFQFIPSRLTGRDAKYFQPREKELESIRSTIFPPREETDPTTSLNHRSFLVTGLGGMGKTELALKFISEYKDRFDAVFFVIADSEARLLEQYSTFAWDLGLMDISDKNNHELCSETFRAWLGDPVKGNPEIQEVKASVKWLLVLDNAESVEVIDKFWPSGHQGSIIVTTRNPLLTPSLLYIKDRIQLQGLSVLEAANLLKTCARDDRVNSLTTDEDSRVIVQWIEGLPMAIIQLGRTIYAKHMTISDFRQLYPTKADLYQHLSMDDATDHNLVTVWALKGLAEQKKEVFDLLCIIAMLDPENIEQRTLIHCQRDSDPDASLTALREYIDNRAELADASLIDVDRRNGEVSVHRVVQEVTKSMIVRSGSASLVMSRVLDRLEAQWPFLNRNYVIGSATKVGRWEECRITYRHIYYLMGVHEELVERKVKGLGSFRLAELLLEAVQYRLECGLSHEAALLLEEVEKIYQQGNIESATPAQDRGSLYRGKIGLAVSSKNGDDLFHYAKLS
ncbi:hypothetical protein VTL71DRAFT_2521 [Oculimacula yallundae]|uniref:NB-ARC domain-containing protein n=1 Tax=Oculimacula yallundae TaxID=86028 RepID=A0ABR4C937_9HELO